MTIEGFENPFIQHLSSKNRWVKLANRIPWNSIVSVYNKQMRNDSTGASHINGRVVLGLLMIKHMCNLSDEETMLQIQENVHMKYLSATPPSVLNQLQCYPVCSNPEAPMRWGNEFNQ